MLDEEPPRLKKEYSIRHYGSQFMLIAPCGEQVGVYPTEEAARQDIERFRTESMSQTAKILVENAIRAQMQLHGVDSETARQSLLARFYDSTSGSA